MYSYSHSTSILFSVPALRRRQTRAGPWTPQTAPSGLSLMPMEPTQELAPQPVCRRRSRELLEAEMMMTMTIGLTACLLMSQSRMRNLSARCYPQSLTARRSSSRRCTTLPSAMMVGLAIFLFIHTSLSHDGRTSFWIFFFLYTASPSTDCRASY